MKQFACLSLAILSSVFTASAATIAYEGFNYTGGSALTGQNGGTGWASAWTISGTGSTVATPGLSYTDSSGKTLVVGGNSGSFAAANNGNFRLTSTSPETVGTTLYVSFIARMDAAGTPFYAGVSLFNAGAETLFLADPNTPTTWGIDTKSGSVVNGTTPVTTQTFLVYRIDFLATSAEIRQFENPLLGVEPALGTATAFATKTAALSWDQIRIQASHTGLVDEIRIGTTYADVTPLIPEPATLGLAAFGGVALLMRRRRS